MDKFEPEKRNEDPMNFHSHNMSSDWRFSNPNLINSSMGLVSSGNPMEACKGDLMESSSCSSASMVDSFCPTIWDPPTNSQNLDFCDINVQNNGSTSNNLGFRKGGSSIEGTLEMGWTPNSILKGGMFVPTASRMVPQGLSQFPADSGFIERAARYSSFSAGNFSAMMTPFGIAESMSPYSGSLASIQGPQEVFGGNGVKSIPIEQSQKNEMNISSCVERGATEGVTLNNEEAKHGVGVSGNESDEAEFSGGGGNDDQSLMETSAKGQGSKKRKRVVQDNELDRIKGAPQPPAEATKNCSDDQKGDQNPSSTTNRPTGKHGKQDSQASDSPKEDYIHIRARRGQATNSHSLAERVRREKISERMKFLQDLVPGCSKVTGKAVMLDEIINYVQSLQRQVEFLSMKLATVNPRLDFSIEGLLAKDNLQSRFGSSSTHGFSPDMSMPYPPMHPSQSGIIQAGLPSLGNSSDALRRTISSQLAVMSGGYKEPNSQVWEDELHNVVQMMGYNASAPLHTQDLSGSLPTGHMKAEP